MHIPQNMGGCDVARLALYVWFSACRIDCFSGIISESGSCAYHHSAAAHVQLQLQLLLLLMIRILSHIQVKSCICKGEQGNRLYIRIILAQMRRRESEQTNLNLGRINLIRFNAESYSNLLQMVVGPMQRAELDEIMLQLATVQLKY